MSDTCGRTFNFVYLHSQERNVKKRSVWTALNKQTVLLLCQYIAGAGVTPAIGLKLLSYSLLVTQAVYFKLLLHMLCVTHNTEHKNVLPISHAETYRVSKRIHHSSSVKHCIHYTIKFKVYIFINVFTFTYYNRKYCDFY